MTMRSVRAGVTPGGTKEVGAPVGGITRAKPRAHEFDGTKSGVR